MDPSIQNIGYLMNKSTQLLKADLNTRLALLDTTAPQWAVLRDLYEQELLVDNDRNVTPAHVAERLNSDRPTISGITFRLSEKGYLRAVPNPTDRRSQLLQLTEKSRELIPRLELMSQQSIEKALSGLNETDKEQFINTLQRIIGNLEQS